ncbi:MAG: hypothetical protein OMM_05746 [Candidatus Magnetoglobus multicellularis str. Araruama]|uniref:Uncharacterized protein n=1 Tax=Candidatus Magnetoglobus multicellularis str. Araruama TaxID=890399 RepID=A0A1V1NUI6_9BACT|nr:MAG: hypothetical protein OMM_05746 [Candidatus Magnetoglobus multicellularis str. Araruama]
MDSRSTSANEYRYVFTPTNSGTTFIEMVLPAPNSENSAASSKIVDASSPEPELSTYNTSIYRSSSKSSVMLTTSPSTGHTIFTDGGNGSGVGVSKVASMPNNEKPVIAQLSSWNPCPGAMENFAFPLTLTISSSSLTIRIAAAGISSTMTPVGSFSNMIVPAISNISSTDRTRSPLNSNFSEASSYCIDVVIRFEFCSFSSSFRVKKWIGNINLFINGLTGGIDINGNIAAGAKTFQTNQCNSA